MDPQTQLWRRYLHRDPTRFLLDSDADPSVHLWYLIDVAHRPEDSAAVLDLRERVLFSTPVQEILAAQKKEGNWAESESLAKPNYSATLWNLALLAELGIPRDSRRARAGCEFAFENFLRQDGRFAGLDIVESGYLIHALAYFRSANDRRVLQAARGLIPLARKAGSLREWVISLWAWTGFRYDSTISAEADSAREQLLNSIIECNSGTITEITFPLFDPTDALFVARVLASYECAADHRAARLMEIIIAKQNEQGLWPLEKSLNGRLVARVEAESSASRWATLNALRVIVELVSSR